MGHAGARGPAGRRAAGRREASRRPVRRGALASALLLCGLLAGAGANATGAPRPAGPQAPVRIAFMPDVHFHDVHATFESGTFDGVLDPRTGRRATIRTMQAQLTSTRLFNENAFAFLAALDDAVARGVRLIALPGDFSDDGQPVHMRGLVRILDDYAARYGIEFFAVPGNHDPVRPHDHPGGKPDFLGRDPRSGALGPQPVYSRGGHPACDAGTGTHSTPAGVVHCTADVRHLGHAGITAALAEHGFMPKPQYRDYATPYSTDGPGEYVFERARAQAQWSRRMSTVCNDGAGHDGPGAEDPVCVRLPDASYVVEPVDGLWLVGLDANVYLPTGENTFTGSGNHGYDRMLRHKPHVITWLADVVARGAAEGKQVIAFSHYPMAEFFNGASDDIGRVLGAEAMQLARRPADATTGALARTGLRVHVGGHMHLNDIGIHRTPEGHTLFNIQAPSLAAYVPAYTLMTVEGVNRVEVETVRVTAVPRFDAFFDLYREERAASPDARWNPAILDAGDYRSFARQALTELVRLRLLDAEAERMRDDLAAGNRELQALATRVFTLQEDERRAISRELHDDIGQSVTAMKMAASSALDEDDAARRRDDLDDVLVLADATLERLRDISILLRPPQLDALGLEAALRWHAERLLRNAGIEASLEIAPLPRRADPAVEQACFRIAQEALTNSVRHARASRVMLRLLDAGDGLALRVQDDGAGFTPAAARGLGLVIMRERALGAGGRIEVTAAPGAGTRIEAWLPYAPDAAGSAAGGRSAG